MNIYLVLTSLLFIGIFLILGFKFRQKAGLAFMLSGSLLMMFLGIGVISSGVEIEMGDVTINATTDIIEITQTTQTFSWLDTTAGVSLLLLGIFLFTYSISSYNREKRGYEKSDFED